jgi:dihydrofolate reductase
MILLIVATDTKNGIAKDGHQPWRLIADERYFQDATLSRGAAVIMGRTTFETLKGPLPGRQNFVASRSSYQADGIEVVSDITGFLADFTGDKDIWVIGGAAIYSLTLSLAN